MTDNAARQPRILNVVTQLEPGGAQTVAFSLHRELVRRSIPSGLLFLYEKSPEHFQTRDFASCAGRRPSTPREFLAMFAQLRSRWRAFRPTAVFAHTHYANAACAIVKATGAPGSLVAVHQNPFGSYPRPAKLMHRAAARTGLFDGEVSVSSTVAASLSGPSGKSGRRVIPNCAEVSSSELTREGARLKFRLPAHRFVVGAVGRLHPQKNHGFLVDLLASLPDVHLAILGEGELHAALAERSVKLGVADRMSLLGAVPSDQVGDFLRSIDVFAMPSLYEGLSLAMLEAMAIGIPFIGSDIPSLAEVAAPPGSEPFGIVVPLETGRWADEVQRLVGDQVWRRRLGERAAKRAADFSVGGMTDAYLAFAAKLGA